MYSVDKNPPPPSYEEYAEFSIQAGDHPSRAEGDPGQAAPYPPQQSTYNPPQFIKDQPGPAAAPAEVACPPKQGHVLVDVGYSADVGCNSSESDDDMIEISPRGLSDPSIRRSFIRKVYLILCMQFAVTVATILLMQKFVGNLTEYYDPDKSHKIRVSMWVCFGIFFAIKLVLLCSVTARRKHPLNIILLIVFTLALSGCVGCVTLYYSIEAVLIAMGSTCIITLGLTIFACQTKIDFTSKYTYLFAVFLVFFSFGCWMIFYYSRVMQVVYASIGVLIFSMFLVYHTQMLIGGRRYVLSEEEYVFAALTIYINVIRIFLLVLRLSKELLLPFFFQAIFA